MTKEERRQFVRECAIRIVAVDTNMDMKETVKIAVELSDALEAHEREQDVKERPECFGKRISYSIAIIAKCNECPFACECDKAGAK